MKRSRIKLAMILACSLFLSACASTVSSAGSTSGSGVAAAEPAYAQDGNIAGEAKGAVISDSEELSLNDYGTDNGFESVNSTTRVYTDAASKLIRQASVSIQTTDFSAAIAALDQMKAEMGGYYESVKTQGGDYYDSNARRYASYTVRIPNENCDAFLDKTGTIGHVLSSSESSIDVGDQYYDTELRLKTLQTKQERLMALLEKADLMEDIIALENSLSDVQYQIEQYTSTLKRYDGLVDYATINITINEVIKLSDEAGEADSLSERLSDAFVNGFSNFAAALGNITVWVAYHFIGIALFAAASAGAVIGGRALRRRNRKDDTPKQ